LGFELICGKVLFARINITVPAVINKKTNNIRAVLMSLI